ncbi:gliding motility lipoprotein GldH [Nafulsella turpanensis]|uniref:gliding motility lipoprotein GldH n=1 Tax=Nafulsella turpanensis TaxID=1265690 RepID=UPI000477707E|nr:gliding motility lipoprotein GldH [Nafulsella turpanensis]
MRRSVRTFAFGILMFAGLYACDEQRVFEQNIDIADHTWHKDSVLQFKTEIADASIPYNVYYNIRNGVDFPTQNLYLRIEVQDSTGRVLTSDLNNIELFDPKTGKPYGDGLGDIFDHQVKVLDGFRFPEPGTYLIEVQHKMRDKVMVNNHLPSIMSVGVRVEKDIAPEEE